MKLESELHKMAKLLGMEEDVDGFIGRLQGALNAYQITTGTCRFYLHKLIILGGGENVRKPAGFFYRFPRRTISRTLNTLQQESYPGDPHSS